MSILDPGELGQLLGLPERVYPVAYLCLGYVTEFLPAPELPVRPITCARPVWG